MTMRSMHLLDWILLRSNVAVISRCTGFATIVPRGKYIGGQ